MIKRGKERGREEGKEGGRVWLGESVSIYERVSKSVREMEKGVDG